MTVSMANLSAPVPSLEAFYYYPYDSAPYTDWSYYIRYPIRLQTANWIMIRSSPAKQAHYL